MFYFLGVIAALVDVVETKDNLEPASSAPVLVLDLPALVFF